MKILVIVIIIFFLLSYHPISAQVNNALIDDFFHSLQTRVYYWRIEETSYESAVLTSFNAVVLKCSGLADKYLFQESDMVVVEKESKYTKKFFSHYYYFPDENEQDMKVEIFLPDSQTVNYTDTQYLRIVKAKELNHIELRIDQFSNVLYEYNTLYLEDLNYTLGFNIFLTFFLFGLSASCFYGAVTLENDLLKIGCGGLGVLFGVSGILWGVDTISDASKVKPRRAELKKLEGTLKYIINTNCKKILHILSISAYSTGRDIVFMMFSSL